MEKPLLTLTTKDYLTGIASSAHTERGGLFFKADGVTSIYDPGGTASVENGLLQAGPTNSDWTASVVVDVPIASTVAQFNSSPFLCFMGDAGHFYKKPLGAGAVTDLRSGTPITSPRNGLEFFGSTVYYWQSTQIGTWDGASAYPTNWTDNAYSGLTNSPHATHRFVGNTYYTNGPKIGALLDNGGISNNLNVLDFNASETAIDISDDGVYLVVVTTQNSNGNNNFAPNRVVFWDTFSSSWQREYVIYDPLIISLERVNNTIYALGQYGVYQISFNGGVQKVISRQTGFGTTADIVSYYGTSRTGTYNNDAFVFGTDTTIDFLGKIQPDVPASYSKPFKMPAGFGRPTLIHTQFDVGRIYVGTTSSKLISFDFNATTRGTGITAQTVYFPFPSKYQIHRIDVVFGEPLVSGDIFIMQTKTDEDTSEVTFGTAAFSVDGATRRKVMLPAKKVTADTQISFLPVFSAGAPKVKKIEIYGQPMTA